MLALSAESGDTVILGTAASGGETLAARYILCEPVDASGTSAVPGVAYLAGHFNRPALTVAQSYAMTRKDEESLRDGGILLSDAHF